MFGMANYTEKNRRAREAAELCRRWRIADKIPGLGAARMEGMALWLFCPACGYRKVAGADWFFRRAKDVEDPMGEFTSKLFCVCKMRGVAVPIIAPLGMHGLRVRFHTEEGHALLLRDDD
jgi:hypothetical protein